METTDPDTGRPAFRDPNTMPQWAGSCWYYLRFVDPRNADEPWAREAERYWMPVDLYVGGAEHAVLHLLYARFWHKVLYDLDLVHTPEPFQKLVNQGMILGYSYRYWDDAPDGESPDTVHRYGVDDVELQGLAAQRPGVAHGVARPRVELGSREPHPEGRPLRQPVLDRAADRAGGRVEPRRRDLEGAHVVVEAVHQRVGRELRGEPQMGPEQGVQAVVELPGGESVQRELGLERRR
jgi:hypothetical protein